MNGFGRFFKINIFGESHGNFIGITIDGVLPGLFINVDDFKDDLMRRSPKIETETQRQDNQKVDILSGLYNDKTTGAPLTLVVKNKDIDSSYYQNFIDKPRIGHADLTAKLKYKGFNDPRGSGQFSGRMTIALVIAGVVAKKMLNKITDKLDVKSELISLKGLNDTKKVLDLAKKEKKTVGGIIKTIIKNIPAGLGEPFFDSFESRLSHILFSVPGVKGLDFDDGFTRISLYGDEFNKLSSIDGGITNGQNILFNTLLKPPASNLKDGRFDLSFATRTSVIIEAVSYITILDFILQSKAYEF